MPVFRTFDIGFLPLTPSPVYPSSASPPAVYSVESLEHVVRAFGNPTDLLDTQKLIHNTRSFIIKNLTTPTLPKQSIILSLNSDEKLVESRREHSHPNYMAFSFSEYTLGDGILEGKLSLYFIRKCSSSMCRVDVMALCCFSGRVG